ncbi:MAG TPA: YggT family protein [Candidatus Nanopelagicaceae bacterium]
MLNVGGVLVTVLRLFLFALLGRLILDYIRMFSRSWRPSGPLLFVVEAIYAITDKPMSFVRRFVPPLRLGAVSLDLSFLVLFFVVQLAIPLVARL